MDKENFINFRGKKIWYRLSKPQKKNDGALFFIHGSRFSTSLQALIDLLKTDYTCLGFAHLGFYKSGGGDDDDTLESRLQQSQFMLDFLKEQDDVKRLSVVGVSMGGHVGARLAGGNKITNLILRAPASYQKSYENTVMHPAGWLPWDQEKMDWPWKPSYAFDGIRKFNGRFLLVESEFEDVVAQKIPDEYFKEAVLAKERKRVILPGAKHHIGDSPDMIEKFASVISDFISV